MDSWKLDRGRIALIVCALAVLGAIAVSTLAAPRSSLAQGPGGYGYGYGYETPTPTTTPTSTPTATPTATPTVTPVPDTTRPRCSLAVVRRQTTRSVRRRGLKVRVRCNENVRAVIRVFVSRKTARKHGIGRRGQQVGSRRTRLAAGQRKTVSVKLNRKARKALRRARKITFRVQLTATDAAGNRRVVSRKATIRRAR